MVFKADNVTEYSKAQNIELSLETAKKAEEVLTELLSFLKPGIKESEFLIKTKEIFQKHGIKKSWHNPHIRFGSHTLLLSHEKNPEDLTLQEEDIAFIDIGPIIGEVEGDFGKTVVFGDNQELHKLQKASEELFQIGLEYFRSQNPSGEELHDYICKEAQNMGYEQLLPRSGHLIGLFAHNSAWNEGLAKYTEAMEPGLWVLEIQIKDPKLPYAAFYENILI